MYSYSVPLTGSFTRHRILDGRTTKLRRVRGARYGGDAAADDGPRRGHGDRHVHVPGALADYAAALGVG